MLFKFFPDKHNGRKKMPRVAKNSAWSGVGRVAHFGTVEYKPIQADKPVVNPAVVPPGGVTGPPTNPLTGKPRRPGELLERKARQFAKEQAAAAKPIAKPRRSKRDYEALIARALAEMDLSDSESQ